MNRISKYQILNLTSFTQKYSLTYKQTRMTYREHIISNETKANGFTFNLLWKSLQLILLFMISIPIMFFERLWYSNTTGNLYIWCKGYMVGICKGDGRYIDCLVTTSNYCNWISLYVFKLNYKLQLQENMSQNYYWC